MDAPSQLAEGRRDDKSIWADFQFFGQLRRVEEVETLFEVASGGQNLADGFVHAPKCSYDLVCLKICPQ